MGVEYMDLGNQLMFLDFHFDTVNLWGDATLHRPFLFSILGLFYNYDLIRICCHNLDLYLHTELWPQTVPTNITLTYNLRRR